MKTPEQVADEAIAEDTSEHLNMEIANAEDVHAIVTRAIKAGRAQRADGNHDMGAALSALHEWAVRVSSYADPEDLDELVEIEQRFGLVDEDGEPTT